MKSNLLPPNILKCLSTSDRRSLGKAGMTPEEALSKQVVKSERELQKHIVALLRFKGIEPNVSRMDKRTTHRVGWPDVVFCASTFATFACAWEVKLHGYLSREQEQMAIRLQTPPNAWKWRVIRSVDEAIKELKEMGL